MQTRFLFPNFCNFFFILAKVGLFYVFSPHLVISYLFIFFADLEQFNILALFFVEANFCRFLVIFP